MPRVKNYRYTGILNRPMPEPQPVQPKNALAKAFPVDRAKPVPIDREKMFVEYKRRIDALMLNCAVDPAARDKWMALTLKLAERHVPGFSFEEPNRKATRRTREQRAMDIYVQMLKLTDKGQSQRNAARIVADRMNRKRDGLKEVSEGALETLYRRLKKDSAN
jgi:hypothetical protein